jgi:nucleoside-diphosphate-sugar epimerase
MAQLRRAEVRAGPTAWPDDEAQRVFITGAAGFIGTRLGERLRESGVRVKGVDRVSGRSVTLTGDLCEPRSWADAAAGSDVVVHTAAVVSNAAGAGASWRANVLGTRRALDAAVRAGARRFVHISSVRAFGDSGFPDDVDEDYPVRPDGNPYVDTKVASEQVVLQAHAAGEIECVVVRPADVYGPRSRPWTVLPVQAIKARRFVLPSGGRGVFSPLYIDNLIDGLVLAMNHPAASGQVFTLSDGAAVTCGEFFGYYGRMLGRATPAVPTWLARGLAAGSEVGAALTGTPTESNRATVRYLARTGTYSIEKARRLLGYSPEVGLRRGMRRTEHWLRDGGFLD